MLIENILYYRLVCYICRERLEREKISKLLHLIATEIGTRAWAESCQSAMKFKDARYSSAWKSATDPDYEDPPFIIEYWSSTTLPPMRNPKDHIQQHVQRESQGASLKEHGHSSRVTSRKGFVASRWNLM